jgi:CheY-like chemotaxis protein
VDIQLNKKPGSILLIEDNPGDIRLIKEALRDYSNKLEIESIKDGVSALEVLRSSVSKDGHIIPDIIILDLNLPKKDGFEILTELKSEPLLKRIPVVIFTASRNMEDINRAYNLGANSYIVKPLEIDRYFKAIEFFVQFWFDIASKPEKVMTNMDFPA